MRVFIPSWSVVTTVASLSTLSCSSSTPTADSGSPTPNLDPSFVSDIIPIFQHSCVFSGCHGVASGMPLVYLGDKMATPSSFAQQVYDGIVNKASVEDPSMPYVTKSDPAMSFLMRKMDGDFASLTCVADNSLFQKYAMQYSLTSPCGGQMPEQLMPLDGDDGGSPGPRDQVRRWIAQGAKNN